MKEVHFKYYLDQEVETRLGTKGWVSMLGYDEAGVQYFVKQAQNSQWFKEEHLDAVKE